MNSEECYFRTLAVTPIPVCFIYYFMEKGNTISPTQHLMSFRKPDALAKMKKVEKCNNQNRKIF